MAILTFTALTVTEALKRLLETVTTLDFVDKALSEVSGMTLGQDICSPADSPPFDKSAMDGYAIRTADLATGIALLLVTEVITAGRLPCKPVRSGEAAQIMTGAPLPQGADAVVKVEVTQRNGDSVAIATDPVSPGTNIIRRGNSVKAGERVLSAGMVLNGSRIGALAEMGKTVVTVRRRPRVAILTTGDELVPIEQTPGPGQIRNSNASMLMVQIEATGGEATSLGIARDERDDLFAKIQSGLDFDALVLSGGVSAGTLDLVPSVLAEAGVREVFHKIEMKPGRPLWFGISQSPTRPAPCYVFGLPGNPVSSLVCCELFVRTAIRRMTGIEPAAPQPVFACLEHDYLARADRPTYHPARLTWTNEGLAVTLVPWHGSSDLCGTVSANGMAFLSGEARQYRSGDRLETFAW